VRTYYSRRYEVARELRLVETPYGPVQVKLKSLEGRVVSASPEYEDCRKVAQKHNLPLADVYHLVEQAASSLLGTRLTSSEKDKGHG